MAIKRKMIHHSLYDCLESCTKKFDESAVIIKDLLKNQQTPQF